VVVDGEDCDWGLLLLSGHVISFFLSFFLSACFLSDSIDHFPVDDFYKIHDNGHIEIIYYLERHSS
jgi:hypothetical protein